jgi:hypothetical protein
LATPVELWANCWAVTSASLLAESIVVVAVAAAVVAVVVVAEAQAMRPWAVAMRPIEAVATLRHEAAVTAICHATARRHEAVVAIWHAAVAKATCLAAAAPAAAATQLAPTHERR